MHNIKFIFWKQFLLLTIFIKSLCLSCKIFLYVCSLFADQSNCSVEKAGILGSMLMRLLPVDDKCSLRGETLKKAIEEDLEKGLIPCYVIATLGTTGTCAFDNLDELGPICKKYNMWLHVDAAYAGRYDA